MSFQSYLNGLKTKIQTRLSAINFSLTAKGATAVTDLSEVPEAIDSIPSEEPTTVTPDGFERPESWAKLERLLDEETDIPNMFLTYDKSVANSLGAPFFYSINKTASGTEDVYLSVGSVVDNQFIEYKTEPLKRNKPVSGLFPPELGDHPVIKIYRTTDTSDPGIVLYAYTDQTTGTVYNFNTNSVVEEYTNGCGCFLSAKTLQHIYSIKNTINFVNVKEIDTQHLKVFTSLKTVSVAQRSISNVYGLKKFTVKSDVDFPNSDIYKDAAYSGFWTCEFIDWSNMIFSAVKPHTFFTDCYKLRDFYPPKEITFPINFKNSPLITHDSLIRTINALHEFVDGEDGLILTLGAYNLGKLTAEEIEIATAKGWTLA